MLKEATSLRRFCTSRLPLPPGLLQLAALLELLLPAALPLLRAAQMAELTRQAAPATFGGKKAQGLQQPAAWSRDPMLGNSAVPNAGP
eukprot:CAMPEP_0115500674 /NCGR_PEP_ID=MMETSP0271-20121206/67993_1 /TAXON_ID=71861 /ORGANISM="Scrippsiella trochoidea, Strain CCMP3099" /LENGTH=87 /DNA_ID=CAMNT_0002929563 /DNA_START=384 /DNA_END=644 /DNA_ORIENTATION=+